MYFATLLDKNYIPRASLMISSLKRHMGEELTQIYILCLDHEVHKFFLHHEKVKPILLADLEDYFPSLSKVKTGRSYVEYIFTLSPFLPLYILLNNTEVKRITSLDADMFFFDNPSYELNALGDNGIGITRHDFHDGLKHKEKFGLYNVSFQSFPSTQEGLACLTSWADDCIEYCGDQVDEHNRFADQKYLDFWPSRFPSVKEFESPFIGLAPWNLKKYNIQWKNKSLTLSGKKIVCYHFHRLRVKSKYHLLHGFEIYGYDQPSRSAIQLYSYYWQCLNREGNKLDTEMIRSNAQSTSTMTPFLSDLKKRPLLFKFGFFVFHLDFRTLMNTVNKLNSLWRN